jgi:hypothetical protein
LDRTDPAELIVTGPSENMPVVPVWSRGRMVLVGDSAHAASSSSGEGASLAVQSAVQLARSLRGLPHPDAFVAYERLRRERVEKIIAEANKPTRPGPPDPSAGSSETPCCRWCSSCPNPRRRPGSSTTASTGSTVGMTAPARRQQRRTPAPAHPSTKDVHARNPTTGPEPTGGDAGIGVIRMPLALYGSHGSATMVSTARGSEVAM